MKTYLKVTEYAFLIAAIFFAGRTIWAWGDNNKVFISLALAIMALFMFLFKRWFRKKMERENSI